MNGDKGRVSLKGIHKRFGSFEALKGINLNIQPREFFALLGPSGSGKSTTLRVIAGLETPDDGELSVDGADVTHMPPGDRNVAMVFQSYALYPHMTLEQNIGFPLKMDGVSKEETAELVASAARKVKIDSLLHRRPGQLSGGQQQRCALARAIVREPRLFLLDEPLSNLDAQLRLETRIELKQLHQDLDVTTIYVTHDQEEAMTMADRIAVFMDGNIVQVGTPEEVFNTPTTIDVAAFIGNPPMNLLPGCVDGDHLVIDGYDVHLPDMPSEINGEVVVGIRPGHLQINNGEEGIRSSVLLSENLGESMLLNLNIGTDLVKLRLPYISQFQEGETLHLSFDPGYVHLFDPGTRRRIARD